MYKTFENLKQFIISEIKVNSKIGISDSSADELPIIKIIPDKVITGFNGNIKLEAVVIPVTLKLVSARDDEIKAFKILDRFIKKINQFEAEKGHRFEGDIDPEYTDNEYILSMEYNLRFILVDTN